MYDDEELILEEATRGIKSKGCLGIIIGLMVAILICGYVGKEYIMKPIDDLITPSEKFVKNSFSPDQKYKIQVYTISSVATTEVAMKCYLKTDSSEDDKLIYDDNNVSRMDIKWIDNDTVSINSHELDLPDGKYDWSEK